MGIVIPARQLMREDNELTEHNWLRCYERCGNMYIL